MKKIIKLIMLMLFLMPLTVKADMGIPGIERYDAYVNKVEGVPYYESNYDNDYGKTTLNKIGDLIYNEEIEIIYEENINKTTYALFEKDNKTYHVKVDDITAKLDSYPLEEAVECKEISSGEYDTVCLKTDEYIVLSDDGIKMHTGPAHGYKIIGKTIPKGTKLKVTHVVSASPWVYTEYNGVKGWVSKLHGTIGKHINKKIITVENVNIFSTTEREDDNTYKILGSIKTGTELNAKYITDQWSSDYFIEYNGISGYIDLGSTSMYQETETIELENDSKMYDIISFRNDKKILIEKINKGTKIETNYRWFDAGIDYAYTTIDKITGWVCLSGCEEYSNNDQVETTTPTINTTTTVAPDIIKIPKNTLSGMEILLLCVFGAIVISVTAIVTIILINKNKKSTRIKTTEKIDSKSIENNENNK